MADDRAESWYACGRALEQMAARDPPSESEVVHPARAAIEPIGVPVDTFADAHADQLS